MKEVKYKVKELLATGGETLEFDKTLMIKLKPGYS